MKFNSTLIVSVVITLVIGVLGGHSFWQSSGSLGAASTFGPSAANNSVALYNIVESELADITAVRNVLGGMSASSTTWNPIPLSGGPFATASTTASTTLTGLGANVVQGSICIASFSTDTAWANAAGGAIQSECHVTATGVATVSIFTSTSTFDFNGTVNVRAFPTSTFITPNALQTATSSVLGQ